MHHILWLPIIISFVCTSVLIASIMIYVFVFFSWIWGLDFFFNSQLALYLLMFFFLSSIKGRIMGGFFGSKINSGPLPFSCSLVVFHGIWVQWPHNEDNLRGTHYPAAQMLQRFPVSYQINPELYDGSAVASMCKWSSLKWEQTLYHLIMQSRSDTQQLKVSVQLLALLSLCFINFSII